MIYLYPQGRAHECERIDIIKRWIEEGAKLEGGSPRQWEVYLHLTNQSVSTITSCLSSKIAVWIAMVNLMLKRRTIKPSAGLQLDTYEWIIKGNVDGTIVTGDPADSTLFSVITLPDDDPEIILPRRSAY